jgi:predicted CopG family antitoxin
MPSQQISVKKEVKEKLEALKGRRESFTDVIQKFLDDLELSRFGGLLQDLSDEEKYHIHHSLYRSSEDETS